MLERKLREPLMSLPAINRAPHPPDQASLPWRELMRDRTQLQGWGRPGGLCVHRQEAAVFPRGWVFQRERVPSLIFGSSLISSSPLKIHRHISSWGPESLLLQLYKSMITLCRERGLAFPTRAASLPLARWRQASERKPLFLGLHGRFWHVPCQLSIWSQNRSQ